MTELGNSVEIGATPRLDRQQVGVAPSIQWEGSHLCAGYNLTQVGCGGLHLYPGIASDSNNVRVCADRKLCVDPQGGIRVDRQVHLPLGCEPRGRNSEFVAAHRQVGEGIEALLV